MTIKTTLAGDDRGMIFFLLFIDRFFKLCYILLVFVKVKEVKRTLRWEAERGTNSFFGFFF
jgi:hypothetical protein